MSALRVRCPDGSAHDIDLGPSTPALLRGFNHRSVPSGSLARSLPAITPELRAKWAEDSRRARAKAATA